jgi:Myb-like DNA-binding domain
LRLSFLLEFSSSSSASRSLSSPLERPRISASGIAPRLPRLWIPSTSGKMDVSLLLESKDGEEAGSTASAPTSPPARKQSKWKHEEDEKIIRLRGGGMKWEDISKQLPGRTVISCRLHYQNYLERRSEWDEDRKDKLARLYERYVEQCMTAAEPRGTKERALQIQASDVGPGRRRNVHPLESSRSHALAAW